MRYHNFTFIASRQYGHCERCLSELRKGMNALVDLEVSESIELNVCYVVRIA